MEVEIYKSSDGKVKMEVNIKRDTVWLTQLQISQLFSVQVPAISKHVSNIYKSRELSKDSTLSKMEIVRSEGGRMVNRCESVYSLDMVISVGYRVNSQKATQFRIWATSILKDHLLKGYSINQKLLSKQREKLKELQDAIYFIENKSHQLILKVS